MMVGNAARLMIAIAAMSAFSVFAEPLRREAYRDANSAVAAGDLADDNHYILECYGLCRGGRKATDVPIGLPSAVTTDTFGNLYFSSPNVVYQVDAKGALFRVAGNGTPGYSGDGGPARDAALNIPFDDYPEIREDFLDYYPLVGGLATDASGNLYIADAYNNRIRRIDSSGIITTVITGIGWPQGVALDAGGALYVSSAWGSLSKIAPDGTATLLAQSNCGPTFRDPGFCVPEQIAVDASGNVFVPDGYCRVRKVTPEGSVVTVAGNENPSGSFAFTCGYSGDDGPANTVALSNMPYGVAVDSAGNLYIADTYNNCIRKVDAGGFITRFAGVCGSGSYSGDGGPAIEARLNRPYGITVDRSGNVFVADTENHRIRMIAVDGIITTVAGNGSL